MATELVPDERLLTVSMLGRNRPFGGSTDFEAMGQDYVVDQGGRPLLLEVHRFPGLWLEDDVSRRFYLEMIQSLHRDI